MISSRSEVLWVMTVVRGHSETYGKFRRMPVGCSLVVRSGPSAPVLRQNYESRN
jgi:hypothetical protein